MDEVGAAAIAITDEIQLLHYILLRGVAPPSPGPEACGLPDNAGIGCDSSIRG